MRIFIRNIPNSFNFGSMMMAENTITYLNKEFGNCDVEYYTEARTAKDLQRLQEATNHKKIFSHTIKIDKVITEKIKFIRYIERKIRIKMLLNKISKFYDAIIILGGDDYSEVYVKLPLANHEIKRNFQDLNYLGKRTHVFMVGQTIGSYTGKRIKWAHNGLKNLHLYSRDDVSATFVKDVLKNEALKSRDLAFLELRRQEEYLSRKESILSKYDLVEGEYITVVGSGLINHYTSNEDKFIESFYEMIKTIKEKYTDKQIVWLSHVITPGTNKNDIYLLDKINERYGNYINKNCVVISSPILPVEARVVMGLGRVTVTCRMHAAVSTYQMIKPAICISYSEKYKGVISRGLGRDDLVIEAKSNELWENGITDEVIKRIEYVEKNYDSIIEEIYIEVEECKKMAKQAIEQIAEIITK